MLASDDKLQQQQCLAQLLHHNHYREKEMVNYSFLRICGPSVSASPDVFPFI
uniref:Uncharacterized protein n=1 Tax=uncultured gamma proteobacterium EB080_L93H08 TaxID=710973 RepID=E0Y2Y8_9GAMM|nr:hypothetical protein [uncultured gamma proteobacterium EB080_L93H08]